MPHDSQIKYKNIRENCGKLILQQFFIDYILK